MLGIIPSMRDNFALALCVDSVALHRFHVGSVGELLPVGGMSMPMDRTIRLASRLEWRTDFGMEPVLRV